MKSLEMVNEKMTRVKNGYLIHMTHKELELIKQDLEFLKVLIDHLTIEEVQVAIDDSIKSLVLNNISEIRNIEIYKIALEYINKNGVKNVCSKE